MGSRRRREESFAPRVDSSRLVALAAAFVEIPTAPRGPYTRSDLKGKAVGGKKKVAASAAGPSAGEQGGAPRSAPAHKDKLSPGELTAWAKRLALEDGEWTARRPVHAKALRAVADSRVISLGRAAEAEKKAVLLKVEHACLFHECCSERQLEADLIEDADARERAYAELHADLTKKGGTISKTEKTLKVVWCGMRTSFLLDVPEFLCSACDQMFVPIAIHAHAFQSSPVTISEKDEGYTRWVDLARVDHIALCRSMGDMSMLSCAAIMEAEYRESAAAVARVHGGVSDDVFAVDDRLLGNVFFERERANFPNTAVGERGLSWALGVAKRCATCATVKLPSGADDPSLLLSVSLDACVKTSSNPNAAKAAHAAGLPGHIHSFIFEAGEAVRKRVSAARGGDATGGPSDESTGGLPEGGRQLPRAMAGGPSTSRLAGGGVPSTSGQAASGGGRAAFGRPPPKFHNHLHCSRAKLTPQQVAAAAVPGAPSTGLVGGVCAHDQPLGFLNMKSAENWGMYNSLLRRLIIDNRVDSIRVVNIDFSCLYQVQFFDVFGEELKALGLLACGPDGAPLPRIKFFVDWLHMQGHVASCRYSNGAMYNDGTGRRVGVGAEVLWAKVRGFS